MSLFCFLTGVLHWPENQIILWGYRHAHGSHTRRACLRSAVATLSCPAASAPDRPLGWRHASASAVCVSLRRTRPSVRWSSACWAPGCVLSSRALASLACGSVTGTHGQLGQLGQLAVANRFNNEEEIQHVTCPAIFIHGKAGGVPRVQLAAARGARPDLVTADPLIPYSHSQTLHHKCASKRKDIWVRWALGAKPCGCSCGVAQFADKMEHCFTFRQLQDEVVLPTVAFFGQAKPGGRQLELPPYVTVPPTFLKGACACGWLPLRDLDARLPPQWPWPSPAATTASGSAATARTSTRAVPTAHSARVSASSWRWRTRCVCGVASRPGRP
jgi:hypothetical protein